MPKDIAPISWELLSFFFLTQVNQTNTDSQLFNKRHTTYRLNVFLRICPKQEFL